MLGDYDLVVNCAGLGSRDLVEDRSMKPVKGQTVRLFTAGSVDEFLYVLDITDPKTGKEILRYILPQ